ncbi:MAG TPA: AI-2E family transporter [Candidatus Limnocylindrales bacterium]|nr:AI-2E family transporter [Candidatus Limnocylindrales bacterium]
MEIDAAELSGVFAVPSWLRDIGLAAWLLVGVTLLMVGIVWILSLTNVIVTPVLTAAVVAAVASPLVGWLRRRGLPRSLSSALLLLGVVTLGVVVVVVIIAGVTSQSTGIAHQLSEATTKIEGWLKDLGVSADSAGAAKDDADSSTTAAVSTLLHGVSSGLETLSSLVFFGALTALSLFFLLKDGPQIRAWGERHLPIPTPVAHVAVERILQSLRGYFLGVTIIAAFNGVVVGLGALLLGVPLPGTIAAITFIAAYVPYLGAWASGAFAVLVALGGSGPDAAAAMIVVELLANGILQQLVQPFAYGSALGIHPLAVLVTTIAGGALFGAAGLILAAPLTAAAVRISADLAQARASERESEEPSAETATA